MTKNDKRLEGVIYFVDKGFIYDDGMCFWLLAISL